MQRTHRNTHLNFQKNWLVFVLRDDMGQPGKYWERASKPCTEKAAFELMGYFERLYGHGSTKRASLSSLLNFIPGDQKK